jgi:glycerate dehydrogenase
MKIVVLDGVTANPGDNPWTEIERLGEVDVYPNTAANEAVARCTDAEIVLTNKVVIGDTELKQLPQLNLICVTATGYNVVDVDAAKRHDVLVCHVPEYSTESVAQFVFAGLLSFIHRPELHDAAIRDGEWQRNGNFSFWISPMTELAGKTFGIVGLGKIGRAVARIANSLGMRVIANSRTEREPLGYADFGWRDLGTLFAESDVVSLHCPQTESNTGFVANELLGSMKPSAILINTARGGLVNEQDLTEALNGGEIAGAILDVVSAEPILDSNPLLTAKNCIITPHVAWATLESRRRLIQSTAKNIRAYLDGQPINLV